MGYYPQESLENPINTMDTLLGVHPIVPWMNGWFDAFYLGKSTIFHGQSNGKGYDSQCPVSIRQLSNEK